MPQDAYDSDTGERDTPNCNNFLTKTPVEKKIGVPYGGGRKALNRKCRAIARIVYSHGWSHKAIGTIFGVNPRVIRRCVDEGVRKGHHPKEEVENDYYYAGEEFREKFPPVVVGTGTRMQKKKKDDDSDDEPEGTTSAKRKRRATPTRRTVKKPRLSSSPLSSPEPEPEAVVPTQTSPSTSVLTEAPETSESISEFLQSTLALEGIVQLTTPAHIALFEARGFTAAYLHAMAQWWTDDEISEALRRLLSIQIAGDEHVHLDVFEIVMLEIAMRKLRDSNSQTTSGSVTNVHTALSLPDFLSNLQGLDLSLHLTLFLANGMTLDRLRTLSRMSAASPAVVYEALARSLQRGSSLVDSQGLSPLEIIALELVLRK
ncbi:hypothetical protein C8F01DRAFT_1130153 [Mycena amicta]|nr:hypothetical protein C8F01DRAFT_1130153 [Mycena amicta]